MLATGKTVLKAIVAQQIVVGIATREKSKSQPSRAGKPLLFFDTPRALTVHYAARYLLLRTKRNVRGEVAHRLVMAIVILEKSRFNRINGAMVNTVKTVRL